MNGFEIAIIGMSCRFPGAPDLESFWKLLADGKDGITRLSDNELLYAGEKPEQIADPLYARHKGILENDDLFDASFFGFSRREAELTDPQHRIFLECAWDAFEHAGINLETVAGPVGVYAGCGMNTYLFELAKYFPHPMPVDLFYQLMVGNDKDYLATRVAYKLNLKGPAVTVGSACSTSLLSVHLACQALIAGECDAALAGGISIAPPQRVGFLSTEAGRVLSTEGACRAFDTAADGMIVGNGVGAVVLKRLEDAVRDRDAIWAVIKGSAVNNDGGAKAGFTAPSLEGQTQVIRRAHRLAGIDPNTVSYVETHGTGTDLGDSIEFAALVKAFNPQGEIKNPACAIGSVKTNIGHLIAAAGIAGLIKTALAIHKGEIPPSLHFSKPNPALPFEGNPFFVNTSLLPWKAPIRRAGVSSFGIGGTNVHVVLEEFPENRNRPDRSSSRHPYSLMPLSAQSEVAIGQVRDRLTTYLKNHPEIDTADAAYTLQTGRKTLKIRGYGIGKELDSFFKSSAPTGLKPLAFLFPGVGRFVNLGHDLYRRVPAFRKSFDRVASLFIPELGVNLAEWVFSSEDRFEETYSFLTKSTYGLPALFIMEQALADMWSELGLKADAVIGHSFGEYAAATQAGILRVEDAARLVALRGRLYERLPRGDMISVELKPGDELPPLTPSIAIAAVNSPFQTVVSGPVEALDHYESLLKDQGLKINRLELAYAGHSVLVEPILEEFRHALANVTLSSPRIPYVSTVTGNWVTEDQITDREYWVRHLRETVHFSQGLATLNKGDFAFLEVGPGQALSRFANKQFPEKKNLIFGTLAPFVDEKNPDALLVYQTLGKLWTEGVKVDWSRHHAGNINMRAKAPLPGYSFQRERFWIGVREESLTAMPQSPFSTRSPPSTPYLAPANPNQERLQAIWQDELGISPIGIRDHFFELGGTSLNAVVILAKVGQLFGKKVEIHKLIKSPTIERLAQLLDEGTDEPKSPLLEIKKGREGAPPLFCVHPAGGSAFVYHDLALALPDHQPVWALYSLATDGLKEEFDSVEDMATYYLEHLRTVQPQGPYFLAGASMGGSVAFEMARQLQRDGQEVGLLALIDAPAPGELPLPLKGDITRAPYLLAWILGVSEERLNGQTPGKMLQILLDEGIRQGAFPKNFSRVTFEHFTSLFMKHGQTLQRYRASHFDGPILFFRASQWDFVRPEQAEEKWKELCTGLSVYAVPGNHLTMLKKPNVGAIAEPLQSWLAEAGKITYLHSREKSAKS